MHHVDFHLGRAIEEIAPPRFCVLGMTAEESLELIDRVASFAESALTVAGRPTSGNARLRISGAKQLLSLEVTHRDCQAFDAVTHDHSAMQSLDSLCQWSTRSGSTVIVERGPRDELRINIGLAQTTEADPHVESRRAQPHGERGLDASS
jgi:hypothetical protein